MNRKDWEEYIALNYNANAEHLWVKFPDFAVFRHANNRKWFAAVMNLPKNKLIAGEDGMTDILNVKCDPVLIGSLRNETGFFPAYHMNKSSWITISLDGTVDSEQIKWLLDMSFDLTAVKAKNRKS